LPGVDGALASLEFHGADPARLDALFGRLGFSRIREPVPLKP